LELRVSFEDGSDTLMRVFNSFGGQVFAFEFDKEPKLLVFDPDNEILLKAGTTVTGIDDKTADKQIFNLSFSPNPFTNKAKIGFSLERPDFVTLELYSNTGVKLRTISEKYYHSGVHSDEFVPVDLKNGIYFVVLRTATHAETIKIIRAE
jgi:hypothetical protein